MLRCLVLRRVVLLLLEVLLLGFLRCNQIRCMSLKKVVRRNLLRFVRFARRRLFLLVLRLSFRRCLLGRRLLNRMSRLRRMPFVLGLLRLHLLLILLCRFLCRGRCMRRMQLGWRHLLRYLFLVLRILRLQLRRSSLLWTGILMDLNLLVSRLLLCLFRNIYMSIHLLPKSLLRILVRFRHLTIRGSLCPMR